MICLQFVGFLQKYYAMVWVFILGLRLLGISTGSSTATTGSAMISALAGMGVVRSGGLVPEAIVQRYPEPPQKRPAMGQMAPQAPGKNIPHREQPMESYNE